jgi:3',5'-cyclic-nucleotide phosphodiesterase
MELYKICPACKEKNPVSEVICRICMTNLSSIRPTSEPQIEETTPNDESTIKALPEVMTFARTSDGRALPVQSDFILGRSGETEDYFQNIMTVSRRHARVTYSDGAWKIEDLGSTNGTWVNGQRIERGKLHAIKKGDVVSLSMACEMRVIS